MKRHLRPHISINSPFRRLRRTNTDRFENIYKLAVNDFLKMLKLRDEKKFKRFKKVQFALLRAPSDITDGVQICNYYPKEGAISARVIVYTAPVQMRANSAQDIYEIIFDALMHLVIR